MICCKTKIFPDLTVNPPEGSFGHPMQLNEDLSDMSSIQWQNELLFKLADIHTGRHCWEQDTNSTSNPKKQSTYHKIKKFILSQLNVCASGCTRYIVEWGQLFGTKVDCGWALPQLLHQDLLLLILKKFIEEFMRWHHEGQRNILQPVTNSPAMETRRKKQQLKSLKKLVSSDSN